MVQPSFLPISIGFLILILVIVITSIVLFVKKKKFSMAKSIGLSFLLLAGLAAVTFVIVTCVNGFNSWYDTQKTNYRVYGTVYEWVDAPANVNLQVFNYTVNGETYAYIPVNTVFKNGSNIIILMKK